MTAAKRQQEEMTRLASIVEYSQDAVMDMTLDGVVVSWNRAAERIYGYAAEEVKGRTATLLVPADRMDETARILSAVRRRRAAPWKPCASARTRLRFPWPSLPGRCMMHPGN
jgi:PAS domain S-box-containing protein